MSCYREPLIGTNERFKVAECDCEIIASIVYEFPTS